MTDVFIIVKWILNKAWLLELTKIFSSSLCLLPIIINQTPWGPEFEIITPFSPHNSIFMCARVCVRTHKHTHSANNQTLKDVRFPRLIC